ncbi:MAG: hypothetical protein JXB15_14845 [Anaerolineales bacterium]|nr:hypothetical protein [Anaerolineales bacterium]
MSTGRRTALSAMLLILVMVTQLACQVLAPADKPTATQSESQASSTPASATALIPATEVELEVTPEVEATPEAQKPDPTPVTLPPAEAGIACFGTTASGITCLDEQAWTTYTTDNSAIAANSAQKMAACPDGRLLVVQGLGISVFEGGAWKELSAGWGSDIANSVACDAQGGVWVALFRGAAFFDGSQWTSYTSEQILGGEVSADLFQEIAVSSTGTVWIMNNSSLASFDGSAWTGYSKGKELEEAVSLSALAFDSQGYPWVGITNGVMSFDGSKWNYHKKSDLGGVNSLAVDALGRTLVGTADKGVFMYEASLWTEFDLQQEKLASNKIRSIAADARGRVWVSTQWGLAVFANGSWQAYRMDNSELVENDIWSAVVFAGGPTLPEAQDKPKGILSGQILEAGGNPLADAPVEICVEQLGSIFYGDTPCSDQPFMLKTMTDGDGRFILPDVPAGYYIITVNSGDGWAQLTGQYSAFSERVLVGAGDDVDVGELTLQ